MLKLYKPKPKLNMQLLNLILIVLAVILQTRPISAHELSDREKHFRETTVTTVENYVRYLSGDDLLEFESLSCLHIKMDYIDMMNRVLDEERIFAGVSYYYQDDLIYFDRMFGDVSKGDFKAEVSDARRMLKNGNYPRGKIPDESLYLAVLSRLFSEYWISIGSYTEKINLRHARKCKDYKFDDHD
jgi:hypothetical protein